jgi:hypothetical protein
VRCTLRAHLRSPLLQAALAEIVTLLGSSDCTRVTAVSDAGVEKRVHYVPKPLRRSSDTSSSMYLSRGLDQLVSSMTEGSLLLHSMLRFRPSERSTAEQALREHYFQKRRCLVPASKRQKRNRPFGASDASVES